MKPIPNIADAEFLELTHNSAYERNYAFALSVKPKLTQIGEQCDVCGNGRLYPGIYPERLLSVVVNRGKVFPDIIGCGAYPLLILSERVLAAWVSLGIQGYEPFPISVVSESGTYITTPVPYFHIKVTGRCELDTAAMGINILFRCPKCLYREIEPMSGYPTIIKCETWDSSDIFSSDLFPMLTLCTRRIAVLAAKHKWTNFRFTPPEQQEY